MNFLTMTNGLRVNADAVEKIDKQWKVFDRNGVLLGELCELDQQLIADTSAKRRVVPNNQPGLKQLHPYCDDYPGGYSASPVIAWLVDEAWPFEAAPVSLAVSEEGSHDPGDKAPWAVQAPDGEITDNYGVSYDGAVAWLEARRKENLSRYMQVGEVELTVSDFKNAPYSRAANR